jgi:hypothetical protein
MLHFYAQRKAFKNNSGITPANYYYATRNEAERQFYLLCASAIANTDENDFVAVEYGTVEQGAVERRFWDFRVEAEEEEVAP